MTPLSFEMTKESVITVTIDLPPEIEAGVLAQAQSAGLEVADYVQNLVRNGVSASVHVQSQPAHPVGTKKRLSELLSTLRGVDIDLSRNPSQGRRMPVNGVLTWNAGLK